MMLPVPAPQKGTQKASGISLEGNGLNLLPIPEGVTVIGVSVSGVVIPEKESRTTPMEGGQTEEVSTPLWRVVNSGGLPHLQRGQCSNNGLWQEGAKILLTIKEAKAPEKEAEAPAKEVPPA